MSRTPEQHNYEEIERLETLLAALRANSSTARETEAIREIGLEIALAVAKVGAMLINVGWSRRSRPRRRAVDAERRRQSRRLTGAATSGGSRRLGKSGATSHGRCRPRHRSGSRGSALQSAA